MPVIDLDVPDDQAARLDRVAMAMRKTRREATAQLIEEALRHEEFPCIEFRGSMASRQAYVTGSGLAAWEVLMVAQSYGLDSERTATHLRWPAQKVEAVLAYVRAYPEEIGRALAENDAVTETSLRGRLPNALWTE